MNAFVWFQKRKKSGTAFRRLVGARLSKGHALRHEIRYLNTSDLNITRGGSKIDGIPPYSQQASHAMGLKGSER